MHFEPRFHDQLEHVKLTKPHLMTSVDDVSEEFGVSWSFRREVTSEVVNQRLPLRQSMQTTAGERYISPRLVNPP